VSALDIVFSVALIGGMMLGYSRGFINQLISIAGLLIAYLVAVTFYDDIAPALRAMLPFSTNETYRQYDAIVQGLQLDKYIYNALAFALLFFIVKFGLTIVGYVLNFIAKAPGLNMLNKWCGALLALAEVTILIIIAVHVLNAWPSANVQGWVKNSRIAPYVLEQAPLSKLLNLKDLLPIDKEPEPERSKPV